MPKTIAAILPIVEEHIARLERQYVQRLRFSSVLERRFQEQTAHRRSHYLFNIGLIALFFFDLLLLEDWFLIRSHFYTAVVIRIGVVTPLTLGLLLLVRRPGRRVLREGAIAAVGCIACAASLVLSFGNIRVLDMQVEPTVLLIFILLNCIFRVDLPFAAPATLLCVLSSLWLLFRNPTVSFSEWLIISLFLVAAALLTLAANFTFNRALRFSYLLRLRGELQSSLLTIANHDLIQLSSRDQLTGLNNRHSYERELSVFFEEAVANAHPLSAIMVDVDHFKSTNDLHGHLYGDRVLQRVASLIQQALRAEADFAARYGGEEFIVLLPDVDHEAALIVAERIRTLVQVAGSPALVRDSGMPAHFTTVSCGVSTFIPTAQDSANDLVQAADRALYLAKAQGRNRVCFIENAIVA